MLRPRDDRHPARAQTPCAGLGPQIFPDRVSLLAPLSVLALILSWPGLPLTTLTGRLENLYGSWRWRGCLFRDHRMFYKIIPVLVWYGSYSTHIGLRKVPSLADLYSPVLQALGYWTYVAGLAVTTTRSFWSCRRGDERLRAPVAQPRDAGIECRKDPQPPRPAQNEPLNLRPALGGNL